MKLNLNKCKVLTLINSTSTKSSYDYEFNSDGNLVKLEHVESIKDLGVMVDESLTFSEHVAEKTTKAFQMLGIINRNFNDMGEVTFLLLHKSLMRSHLEFAHSIWCPYKIGMISDLEKVQMRATKMVRSCKQLSYIERLKFLKLPILKFRRLRGDIIETFKILNGFYDVQVVPNLVGNLDNRTRGSMLKLSHIRCKYYLRKYSFCVRIINAWNFLPDNVVCST